MRIPRAGFLPSSDIIERILLLVVPAAVDDVISRPEPLGDGRQRLGALFGRRIPRSIHVFVEDDRLFYPVFVRHRPAVCRHVRRDFIEVVSPSDRGFYRFKRLARLQGLLPIVLLKRRPAEMQRQRIEQIAQFIRPAPVRLDLPKDKPAVLLFQRPHGQIRLGGPRPRVGNAEFFETLHVVAAEYAECGERRPAPLTFAVRPVRRKPKFRFAESLRLRHHQLAVRPHVFQRERLRSRILHPIPHPKGMRPARHEKVRIQLGDIAPLNNLQSRPSFVLGVRMRKVSEFSAFGTMQMPRSDVAVRHPSPDLHLADLAQLPHASARRFHTFRFTHHAGLRRFKRKPYALIIKTDFHIPQVPNLYALSFCISFISHFFRSVKTHFCIKFTFRKINRAKNEQICIDKRARCVL